MAGKKRVLFLCGENACRSQMAEGILRATAGDRFEVVSAGATATSVNPRAVAVMAELGIDISGHASKPVSRFNGHEFDYVVTVCEESRVRSCAVFPGPAARRLHWPCDDPAQATGDEDARLTVFRRVRDEIRARIARFAGHDAVAD